MCGKYHYFYFLVQSFANVIPFIIETTVEIESSGSEVIKLFSCSTEQEIYHMHKC